MENMSSTKTAAEYLTIKFGWPVRPHEIGILARSGKHPIRVDRSRPKHLYAKEDIEKVILSSPDYARECRRPFWFGTSAAPREVYYFENNKMS